MRWISSIGGAIATGAAALVLVSLPSEPVVAEPVAQPIAVAIAIEPTEHQIVDDQPLPPDIDVPDLGDSIADVLAESGYTQFVDSDELAQRLSDDVVQVLISQDAVLVIPSDEGGE